MADPMMLAAELHDLLSGDLVQHGERLGRGYG